MQEKNNNIAEDQYLLITQPLYKWKYKSFLKVGTFKICLKVHSSINFKRQIKWLLQVLRTKLFLFFALLHQNILWSYLTGKNKCSKNRILLSFVPKSPQYSLCIIATMKWTSGLLVFLYFLSDVKGLFKSRQIKVEETVQDQSCVKQFLGVQTKPYPQRYIPREVGCCNKIVGGQEVCRRYPWVLGLWRTWGSRPFCGGSLINDRWMLTGGSWSS